MVVVIFPVLDDHNIHRFRLIAVRQCRLLSGSVIRVSGQRVAFGKLVRVFHHLVGHFLARHIRRQIGPRLLPRVGRVQLHGFNHRLFRFADIRSDQGNFHILRALAVLVILVIPDLLHGHLRRNREIGVGNHIARRLRTGLHLGVRCRYVKLFHVVADFLPAVIARKLCPGVGPRVVAVHLVGCIAHVQRDRLTLCRAVRGELHADRRRTLTRLVVVVVPDLCDFHFGLFRNVCIRHEKAGRIIARHNLCIVRGHVRFIHRVDNRLSAGHLVQIRPCVGPVVGLVQNLVVLNRAVRKQLHRDRRRTDAILVFLVIPDLRHLDRSLFRIVFVFDGDHGFAFQLRDLVLRFRIPLRYAFHDIVADACAALVHRQSCPLMCPFVSGSQLDIAVFNLCAVRGQVHGKFIRTLAVLVVFIVPALGHADLRFDDLMRVGKCVAHGCQRIVIAEIAAVNPLAAAFFFHRVDDFLAHLSGAVFRQTGKGIGPAFFRHAAGQRMRLGRRFRAVREHTDQNRRRTHVVAVIVIRPLLGDSDLHRFGRMRVPDHKVAFRHCRIGIVIGAVRNPRLLRLAPFFYGIDDFHAVFEFVKALEFMCPCIAGARDIFFFRDQRIALEQTKPDILGTDPFDVALVVPLLCHHDRDLRDVMLVFNGECVTRSVRADFCVACRHIHFIHAVNDHFAVHVGIQLCPLVFPRVAVTGNGVARIQRHGHVRSVQRMRLAIHCCGQLHRKRCRTQLILVIVVIPDLCDLHLHLFGIVGVCHRKDLALCAVRFRIGRLVQRQTIRVKDRILHDGIHQRHAVFFQRLVLPLVFPVVCFIQRHLAADRRRALKELHGHLRGTLLVKVVVILPHLLYEDILRFRCVLVRKGEAVRRITRARGFRIIRVVRAARDPRLLRRAPFLDGIGYHLSVFFLRQILKQVCKRPRIPGRSLRLLDGHILNRRRGIALEQTEADLVRTHAVLIILVIPHLCDGDAHVLRRVGVGDRHAADCLRVARRQHFIQRIGDRVAVYVIFRQVLKGVVPGIALAGHIVLVFAAVRAGQNELHRPGTHAVLVVVVVPDLPHRFLRQLFLIVVGNFKGHIAVAGQLLCRVTVLITGNRQRIARNVCAVLVFRHAVCAGIGLNRDGTRITALRGKFAELHRAERTAVLVDREGQILFQLFADRRLFSLGLDIFIVRDVLCQRDGTLHQFVGHGESCRFAAGHRHGVAAVRAAYDPVSRGRLVHIHTLLQFLDGIGDLLTALPFTQAADLVVPGACRAG